MGREPTEIVYGFQKVPVVAFRRGTIYVLQVHKVLVAAR